MHKFLSKTILLALILGIMNVGAIADNSNPPVKKSKTGICHPQGGTYYGQTKNFTPYKSMDECIKSGGRMPKK